MYITTLTYKLSHTCFRLYLVYILRVLYVPMASIVGEWMCICGRRWCNTASKRWTIGFSLHRIAVPLRFGNGMTFIIGRHAGVCVVVRPE